MKECKHGCGYKHRHQGTMNLHESIHCPTLKKVTNSTKPLTVNRFCDCDTEPTWRFLSRTDAAEAKAAAAGYKKICEGCGEVI